MSVKCQTMDAVCDCRASSTEPRKIYFGSKEGKWNKGIIIMKSHSITNDIHMRGHLKLCAPSEGNFRYNS